MARPTEAQATTVCRHSHPLAIAVVLCAAFTLASSTPMVSFPFNSQIPTVARVGQPYLFQFSESTFAPLTSDFTYSLSEQPTWLLLDGATRTFSGVPGQGDTGSSTFVLTAADITGAAHMQCTLVVSGDQPPLLQGDISKQLEADANLSSIDPATVTLLPSSSFTFHFNQDSFIDIMQRALYYYATLTDHTPLPAWLHFDANALTFSGTVPQLSAFPQSFEVDLIASDVAGFAGASATFTIVVGITQLVFLPEEQDVHVTPGTQLDFTMLQDEVWLNGEHISLDQLKSTEASLPGWLTLDTHTLALTGTAPSQFIEQNVTVTVKDEFGDTATATLHLIAGNVSLISGTIGTLTAYAGEAFDYRIPSSMVNDSDATFNVRVPPTATWLKFDRTSRELRGIAPTEASPASIQVTLTAEVPNVPGAQTQIFTIDVKPKAGSSSSATPTVPASRASPTNSSTLNPGLAAAGAHPASRLKRRVIAGIVMACFLGLVLFAALLIIYYRRRRQQGYERQTPRPSKRTISRPILSREAESITITTEVQTDVEKTAGSEAHETGEVDRAPQLALNLPIHSAGGYKWSNRVSHISQVSSLGNGEDAIKADSNIPEWGRESAALHAPHDSFSVPAEMARVSRQLSQLSSSKRGLQRLREKRQSQQSVGLGFDTPGLAVMPRHSFKRASSHKRKPSSLGLSATLDRSSCASLSTRGTSVLSTRASDFPRPPTRSAYTGSRSVPTLSITEADKRRSIRLVSHSDGVAEDRPLEEKRQSFIRKRASTSLQSPLFAHGPRASSSTRYGAQGSLTDVGTSVAASVRRSRRGKSHLPSYSESSSLEPSGRNSKRLSQRVRSAFAPNFPRAITRSSLGADDERTEGGRDSSSGFYTTSSSISEDDLTAEMALPRHQRAWVLPGEASPTPPPIPPTSRQASSQTRHTPNGDEVRQKWKDRFTGDTRSLSPLSTAIAVPVSDRDSLYASGKASQSRRSRLSEPLSLVSNDSLSSLRADPETDTQGGSEQWDDVGMEGELEGTGLVSSGGGDVNEGMQRSNISGPAFL